MRSLDVLEGEAVQIAEGVVPEAAQDVLVAGPGVALLVRPAVTGPVVVPAPECVGLAVVGNSELNRPAVRVVRSLIGMRLHREDARLHHGSSMHTKGASDRGHRT